MADWLLLQPGGAISVPLPCWNPKLEGESIVSCHKCANCLERDAHLANFNKTK